GARRARARLGARADRAARQRYRPVRCRLRRGCATARADRRGNRRDDAPRRALRSGVSRGAVSRRWYLVALVPGLIGMVLVLIGTIRMFGDIADMQRMLVPGEHAFELGIGDYRGYVETESEIDGRSIKGDNVAVECTLTVAGAPVALKPRELKGEYSTPTFTGTARFDFTMPKAGSAHFACTANGRT